MSKLVNELYQQALRHHNSGGNGLLEAGQIYGRILAIDPKHADTLHMTGVLAYQQGQYKRSINLIKKAIKINNKNAIFYNNLGLSLKASGDRLETKQAYEQGLAVDPKSVNLLLNYANFLRESGEKIKALEYYTKTIEQDYKHFLGHYNLATLYKDMGQLEIAINHFRKCTESNPNFAEAFGGWGLCLQLLGKSVEAIPVLQKSIRLKSTPDACTNLGLAIETQIGKLKLCSLELALQCHLQAIEIAKSAGQEYFPGYNNAGNLFQYLGNWEKSLEYYEISYKINPNYAVTLNNLGAVYQLKGELDKSIDYYDKALAVEDSEATKHNKALVLLRQGKLVEGFELNKSRWKVGNLQLPPLKAPLWEGQDITKKTLFFFSEQGFGDSLQFVRYIDLLLPLVKKLIVQCPTKLLQLFQQSWPSIEFHDIVPQDCKYDYALPYLCAPRILKTTIETIPNRIPYLNSVDKNDKWKNRLLGFRKVRKIGLVWSGAARIEDVYCNVINSRRSMVLSQFQPLFNLPNTQFFSLQVGPQKVECLDYDNIIDWTDDIGDWNDTCAFIKQLDMVIGVDTSTPHASAACGVKTIMLSRFDACWRWLSGPEWQDKSPWYPEVMKIFRQDSPGVWESVITQVVDYLK